LKRDWREKKTLKTLPESQLPESHLKVSVFCGIIIVDNLVNPAIIFSNKVRLFFYLYYVTP